MENKVYLDFAILSICVDVMQVNTRCRDDVTDAEFIKLQQYCIIWGKVYHTYDVMKFISEQLCCKIMVRVDTEMAVLLVYWSALCLVAVGTDVQASERGQCLTCPHRTEVSPASTAPPNLIGSTCLSLTGFSPDVSWWQNAFS